MQSGGGTKNPPWARPNVNAQVMDPNLMAQQGIMPFQQTAYNANMIQPQPIQMAGQMAMNQIAQGQIYPGNVVAYPTPRAMNPNIYQNSQSNAGQNVNDQRVFTGTITKIHNDFGFVDHDVFYQTSVCANGVIPKLHDRVLVEATFNPNMPFKWNASRVQVLPKTNNINTNNSKPNNQKKNSNYNAVPPPPTSIKKPLPSRRDDRDRPPRREERTFQKRSRSRSRSRSRDRRDSRSRRDSPPRKRPAPHQPSPPKYAVVRVPRIPLEINKVDVPTLSQRYTNLYIPSDFFNAHVKWPEVFPPQSPFSLNSQCDYHIMPKEAEIPEKNDAVLEPPDANYKFSAKVMLISTPTLEALYQKCGLSKEDKDSRDKRGSKSPLHPTRLIKFLVGQKGKGGENFAIGGPWSPSLDGENPETDPSVLVKTAIRSCKALTGIDLSSCTQWYRMVEFYYWREGSNGKSRLECVVLYLPDVWSVQSSRVEWSTVQENYKAACDAAMKKLDPKMADEQQQQLASADGSLDGSQIDTSQENNDTITIEENEEEGNRPEATHYTNIDLKTIKVDQLRLELRARKVSFKGNRSQLVGRLSKLIKAEESNETKDTDVMEVVEDDEVESKKISEEEVKKPEVNQEVNDAVRDEQKKDDVEKPKEKTEKEIEEEQRKIEKEKQILKTKYELPESPHIIVHPSSSAKGGKFACNVASLSVLLDYRIVDNKEHSFEIFVFAELFNEMLQRDFGFYIYKTLYSLEEKKDEKKSDDKDGDKDKKEEKEKKDDKDKKDDKRDSSRRRERKDSRSDDERSGSPKRRNFGVELPQDPFLLLALIYFDTSRGGSFMKKDLQNLFMSLGLQLSRSQIKNLLEKVCVKDTFSFKNLLQSIKDVTTGADNQDVSLDAENPDLPGQTSELDTLISSGNRNLLPLFGRQDSSTSSADTRDVSDTGVVTYKNRVVNIASLVASESKNAAVRTRLESALLSARAALKAAKAAALSTHQAQKGAQTQISEMKDQLENAKARITSLTASSRIFHTTLKSIQTKVEAVVNIKYEEDESKSVANGPAKSDKKEKPDSTDKDVKTEVVKVQAKEESLSKEDSCSKDHKKDEKSSDDNISNENMEIENKE